MDTLASIAEDVAEEPLPLVEVDISRFVKGDRKVTLQWKAPSVRQFYMIEQDAVKLLRLHPDWLATQAMAVATIAVCHVAPIGGKSAGHFYAEILQKNTSLWLYLIQRLNEEFPHLVGKEPGFIDEVVKLCVQYLNRHPHELDHLPAEILDELRRVDESMKARTIL